jgi:hypothetical protein
MPCPSANAPSGSSSTQTPTGNAYNLGVCLHFAQAISPAWLDRALAHAAQRHPLIARASTWSTAEACGGHRTSLRAARSSVRRRCRSTPRCRPRSASCCKPYDLAQGAPLRAGIQPLPEGCLVAWAATTSWPNLHSLAQLVRDDLGRFADDGAGCEEDRSYADFVREQHRARRFAGRCRVRGVLARPACRAACGTRARRARIRRSAAAGAGGPPQLPDRGGDGARTARRRAGARSASAFAFLLTAFQALLAQEAGRDTIAVGSPYAARRDVRFAGTFGYLVKLLPMVFTRSTPRHTVRPGAAAQRRGGARGLEARCVARIPSMAQANPSLAAGCMEATLTFQKTASGLEPEDRAAWRSACRARALSLDGRLGTSCPSRSPRAQFPRGHRGGAGGPTRSRGSCNSTRGGVGLGRATVPRALARAAAGVLHRSAHGLGRTARRRRVRATRAA